MVSIPPLAENRIAERDGCDCPSWTLRCAHFGSARVFLIEDSVPIPGCVCVGCIPRESWSVGTFDGPTHICPRADSCTAAGYFRSQERLPVCKYNSLPDAEAAFAAAVEEMLRGDS